MAEGDSLRKQIEFLSGLINSHKTGQKPNRKPVFKNQASLQHSRGNTSSTKWKKEVVLNKNVTGSNQPLNKQLKHVQNSRKHVLKSKTVLSCGNFKRSLPTNKFSYRKTLDENGSGSKTCESVVKSKLQVAIPVKKKEGMCASTNKCSVVLGTKNLQPNFHISKHAQKRAAPNKYKLNRKIAVTKSAFPNSSTHCSSSRKQIIGRTPKDIGSSLSTAHITKPKSKNKSGQSRSNYQWSRKQKTSSKSLCNISKNDLQHRTIPKGSKLKWKRKSGTHFGATALNKMRPINMNKIEQACQSQTIAKTSKLKWRRRNASHSSSVSVKKSKVAERKHLVHKSRYSLKRISNNHENVPRHVQQNVWVQFGKSKMKNRSFVSRRMKYIAHGSLTNKHILLSNTDNITYAGPRRAVKIRGTNYIVGSHGKTLHKTETVKWNKTMPSTCKMEPKSMKSKTVFNKMVQNNLKRQNSVEKHKNERANKIVRRSKQNIQASMKKDNRQKLKSQHYCMFYNRFGKCVKQKQGICPYIHDPAKIAVCTRFLRGTCQQMDGTCPFSHKIDKEKMPICQYFLKGKCTRDECPYSHVNVGNSAVVCEDFLRGYCAKGFKCKRKHVLECEEFNTTGRCPNGAKCKLIHRKKKRKRYFQESASSSEAAIPELKKMRQRSSDGFLALEGSTQSDNTVDDKDQMKATLSNEEGQTSSSVTLQIRPKFKTKSSSDGCILPREETSSDDSQTA